MSDLQHLKLKRVDYEAARKKKSSFPKNRPNFQAHGNALQQKVDNVLRRAPTVATVRGINPALILTIDVDGDVDDADWRRSGLIVVGKINNRRVVLFSNDLELKDFKERLGKYKAGPPEGQKHPPYEPFFAAITDLGYLTPNDRIGRGFKAEDITSTEQFNDTVQYTVDIEFWHTGSRDDMSSKLATLRTYVTQDGGHYTDQYLSDSLALARVKCKGSTLKILYNLESITLIDSPPKLSLRVGNYLQTSLRELGEIPAPPENCGKLCVIDSGISAGHPLLAPAVGEATAVPAQLGDGADASGHGTSVAGLALYGDVAKCLETRQFIPQLQIFSARVLNANNQFDDEKLIENQMSDAIRYFRREYDCRVFNISLGDPKRPYDDQRISSWAAILDFIARQENIVIVISAGNFYPQLVFNSLEHLQQQYPHYLLDPPARILEPATACNALTVGSIAERDCLSPIEGQVVGMQPIARINHPSPFTRSGPSTGGAIKPDLCEYGGNWACDGEQIIDSEELSTVSLNRQYTEKLFAIANGTSLAAPRIAHAAAKLLSTRPESSANLIRALLANSAAVPRETIDLLGNPGSVLRICGYGRPDFQRAQFSDDNRVVLMTDAMIGFDNFHIYEVPIVPEFINTRGRRTITVTLAYDSPVRHSRRTEYLGVKMYYRLIRGKNEDEVADAFRHRTREEGAVDRLSSTRFDCPLKPGPQIRENSTLQKSSFTMIQPVTDDYGDKYYLVVGCQKESWTPENLGPQRYAVVVSVEHEQAIDIYNAIKVRIEPRVEIPVRIEVAETAPA